MTLSTPWFNVYWFARMLIHSDKYGGVGNDTKTLATLASSLRSLRQQNKQLIEKELVELVRSKIRDILLSRYKNAKKKLPMVKRLCDDLDARLITFEDVEVFILTCESVMIPIHNVLTKVPSSDKEFAELSAKTYLDKLGEKGLATLINLWDDLGEEKCLEIERSQVVLAFGELRKNLKSKLTDEEADVVLSAFAQELERRLLQKRKGRAGGSLEDVASFILKYYDIKAFHVPEHFQADIEIDKWVKAKDGWLIGISCKRTLRERWKQVSSADPGLLSQFKIRYIWHLVTYDEDLSDDKLTLLGKQRHIFYLRDDSRRYIEASKNVGTKDYVRPMSHFIMDLKKEIG